MKKYALGLDYGTLSARVVLIDCDDGTLVGSSVYEYSHGVMCEELPGGKKLSEGWALQHPQDYIDAFVITVKDVLKKTKVSPECIIGIGVDFTACTILPVKKDGMPLCLLDEYKNNPHAYVKLWKHHAAQPYADILNQRAAEEQEQWLPLYGNKISCEWMIPKVMQLVAEAPEIYEAADKIMEAGDWLVMSLTGKEARSACFAGYKALWHYKHGYPSNDFIKKLDPRLDRFTEKKLSDDIYPLGSKAGELTEAMADLTGLKKGTAVSVGLIDAHASMLGCGISSTNKLLLIMGTSSCHIFLAKEEKKIPGICGVVKDGVIPNFFAYEAGQSCVGDQFAWFTDNCIPADYQEIAKNRNISIHQVLTEQAAKLKAGESGLLALDWWNGVRSVYMDFDLTGMILGMTLSTKPEEIYRALIESTAYGTRKIIEAVESHGVHIDEIVMTGGIATKNPFAVQIYADVCNRTIKVADNPQSGAIGSAIYGAIAGMGPDTNIPDIIQKLGSKKEIEYRPIPENANVYQRLYQEYDVLSQYFYKQNKVMKVLKRIKNEQRSDI